MVFKLSYHLRMSSFKNQNSSQQTPGATSNLEIRTRQRLQFELLTYQNDVASHTLLDDVVSPLLTTKSLIVPPRFIVSPTLRQLFVRNALASLSINHRVCERVGPMIEKYVMQIVEAAEAIGVREFGVVAEVEVIKVDIFDQQEVLGKTVYSASLSEFDHSSCILE